MIFFDIDETLLNQKRSEEIGAMEFRILHRFDSEYTEAEFFEEWNRIKYKHIASYLSGIISFQEQRRLRVKDIFDNHSLSDERCDSVFDDYRRVFESNWILFDDVLDTLDNLSDARLGIISNGDKTQQRKKLNDTGILDSFDMVVISDDIGIPKPARELFEYASEKAKVRIDECMYIGDRIDIDAQASSKAGMRGVWLNRNNEENVLAIEEISTLREIRGLIATPEDD